MNTLSSLLSRRSVKTALLATAAVMLVGGARISAQADTPDQSAGVPTITVAADAPQADSGARRFHRGPERSADQAAPERPAIDKKLSLDQVRDIVAGRLAMQGNPNLKVGKVTAKEDGVATAEIVTKTGALVDTRDISTRTGLSLEQERRIARMRERFHGGGREHWRGREQAKGPERPERNLALTVDQARKLAEARLILRGNPHLKVGAVKEKDADTITVDIVAGDNSLVRQEQIDRKTGRPEHSWMRRT